MPRLKATIEERFWSSVVLRGEDECWPWIGTVSSRGRGFLSVNGRNISAPRVAIAMTHMEWPSEHLDACHHCDNPNCVNPGHIWLGSRRDNLIDAGLKGRTSGQRKTHCPSGHAYTAENTMRDHRGHRRCRTCHVETQRAWEKRSRAAIRAALAATEERS